MSKAIDRARSLRKRLTPQEVKMWVRLRSLRPVGLHFRRQAPIGPYIVDFACLKHGLAIEIDGGHHGLGEFAVRDNDRDAYLRSKGLRVLRFWNSEIDQNLEGVLESIVMASRDPHPARWSAPPSPDGGGTPP